MKKMLLLILVGAICVGMPLFGSGGQEKAERERKPVTLNIVSHRVHKLIATRETGGDIITPFVEDHPYIEGINWINLDIAPIHDRLFREASLPSTDIDVCYVLNPYLFPRIANLLEPLDGHLEEKPIEGFEENFPKGMLESLSFGGKLYGIPLRNAIHTMHWNKKVFDEKGVSGPPETPEDWLDAVKKLTFARSDGTKVYGFLMGYYYQSSVTDMARMWNGDFITTDLKVACDEPATVKALEMLREIYAGGYMPQNAPSISHPDKQRIMSQCNIGLSWDVAAKVDFWNDPKNSACPGEWKVAPLPVAAELSDQFEVGPSTTEFWSVVIPKNSKNKDLAWDLINYLSSAEPALKMALNGNVPARQDVFDQPEYMSEVPYADVIKIATQYARVPMPAFDKSTQATEIIRGYIEQVMFGEKEAQAAMDELAAELRDLSDELK